MTNTEEPGHHEPQSTLMTIKASGMLAIEQTRFTNGASRWLIGPEDGPGYNYVTSRPDDVKEVLATVAVAYSCGVRDTRYAIRKALGL